MDEHSEQEELSNGECQLAYWATCTFISFYYVVLATWMISDGC